MTQIIVRTELGHQLIGHRLNSYGRVRSGQCVTHVLWLSFRVSIGLALQTQRSIPCSKQL